MLLSLPPGDAPVADRSSHQAHLIAIYRAPAPYDCPTESTNPSTQLRRYHCPLRSGQWYPVILRGSGAGTGGSARGPWRVPLPFRVPVNTSYEPLGPERAAFFEGCLATRVLGGGAPARAPTPHRQGRARTTAGRVAAQPVGRSVRDGGTHGVDARARSACGGRPYALPAPAARGVRATPGHLTARAGPAVRSRLGGELPRRGTPLTHLAPWSSPTSTSSSPATTPLRFQNSAWLYDQWQWVEHYLQGMISGCRYVCSI